MFKNHPNFKLKEPPEELFGKIMHRISKEQRLLRAKRRIIIFSIGLFGSLLAFIPTFHMLRTGIIESGFIEFFSLLFSDSWVVMTYWQNFILTLLESIPSLSIAAFLTTVFVFLGSLKYLMRNIKMILTPIKLTN